MADEEMEMHGLRLCFRCRSAGRMPGLPEYPGTIQASGLSTRIR
jgi:hypothetical protein